MQNNQRESGHAINHQYDSLQELFDAYGFHGHYNEEEISTGNPCGAEILDDSESLDTLFKNYDGDYHFDEMDWGNPVGNEIW